jgi:hypothetical protein
LHGGGHEFLDFAFQYLEVLECAHDVGADLLELLGGTSLLTEVPP